MITERAPAKVNLTLKILGRRADGYHELASLVAFANDAYDVVTLDCTKPAAVTLGGPFAQAIQGPNIAQTAIERLLFAQPRLSLGAIHIEKNLPVAAGVGGGSANAGAVLRLVRRANPSLVGDIDWHSIAAGLGADVPVCFLNETALMTGTGEKLTALGERPRLNAVLINPQAPVPEDKTAQVFRRLNAPQLAKQFAPPRHLPSSPNNAELLAYMKNQGNDLEPAARQVVPKIANVLAALKEAPACQYASLSGAGPTCFGIFNDNQAALAAAREIGANHPDWWVTPTVL
ncbi:MAG: 4-(cytidine 5'-diphospho)-2-C-methyl-D-erythritol kinase [Alphaproteobacteria bacterium]|nr:4-(cytidine 5'-diphospho)-2-C-methyl-D-erythritol kinase [Alphaproteobacteria bacterium]